MHRAKGDRLVRTSVLLPVCNNVDHDNIIVSIVAKYEYEEVTPAATLHWASATVMIDKMLCLLGTFHAFCVFQNQLFSKNSFKNTIRVSNSLDPDQARRSVGPDLVPNCSRRG